MSQFKAEPAKKSGDIAGERPPLLPLQRTAAVSPYFFAGALAVILFAAAVWAQTVAEKPGVDVRRVGMRLQCQCGCKDSVASCSMLECGFSKPAKEKIGRMQAVGMSDQQIIADFVRENGAGVYLAPPGPFGWIVPYASVGVGLGIIWLFVKKYRKPTVATEIGPVELDDPELAKYKDQIEKDLANLE